MVVEGLDMKTFKANRRKAQRAAATADAKIKEEQDKGKDANQAIINQYIEQLKLKQQQAAATILQNNEERTKLELQKQLS